MFYNHLMVFFEGALLYSGFMYAVWLKIMLILAIWTCFSIIFLAVKPWLEFSS